MKEKNNSFSSQKISKSNNSKMKLTNTESFTSYNSSFSTNEKEDVSSKMKIIIKKIEEYQNQNEGKIKEEEISFQIKKILLEINKKIYNIVDEKNNTFLHILAEKSSLFPLKIISNTYYILLDNENSFFRWFFLENSDKLTVLDIASIKGNKQILLYLYSIISKTNISRLKFEANNKKNTIFHYSAKNNVYYSILFWYEKFQKYFPNTKIFDSKNANNLTPLHLACFNNCYECASLLIDLGSDINAVDINGKSVLTYAINSKNIKIIELLLLNGADPDKKDSDGKRPYDYSLNVCDKNIQLLLNKGNQINYIINNKNCFEIIQLLLLFLFFIFLFLSRFLDIKGFNYNNIFLNKYIYIGIILLGISFLFSIITLIFISYFFCCIKHKQHLKRKKPNLLNLYEKYSCDICIKCLRRKKEKTYHCILCNLCIEKWKFHSYWLNTCITEENLIKYKIFVFSLIILLFSNITSEIFFLLYAFLDKKEYENENNNNLFNNFFYLYDKTEEKNKKIKNFIFIPFFSVIIIFFLILTILIIIKLFKKYKKDKNNFNYNNVHYHDLGIGLINNKEEDDNKNNNKSFSLEASDGD